MRGSACPRCMLGLHPGLGGTVRLPRLINPIEAMSIMLTGRNLRAGRAKSLGLVDAVVPERHVEGRRHRRSHRPAEDASRRLAHPARQQHARAQARRQAHARGDREDGADRALSGAARPDRSVGESRRRRRARCRRPRSRRSRGSSVTDTVAQSGARLLPAREAQGPCRRRASPASASTSSAPAPWAATSRPGAPGTASPSRSPT